MTSTTLVSETSKIEKEHVIKVLEHERRIYKLETSIAGTSATTEEFEEEEFEERSSKGRGQKRTRVFSGVE